MNQPLPLVEQLKSLEHLQELDLKIDSIKKAQNALPQALKTFDDALAKLKSSLETKKNLAQDIEKTQRQAKAALDINQDRLSRSQSKLEGVQNSQEFQAATKEIEQLKKMNASLEEQMKKADSDLEQVQKDMQAQSEQVEKIQAEREKEAGSISGHLSKHHEDLEVLLSERKQFAVHVESKTLAVYDRIRGARAGLGIVPAVGGRCKGCNMMLPPQLFNEVQRCTTVHHCPSCHRLIFVPGSHSSESSAAKEA
ncbi:MAG: zinc ribbon domain-containing protein [Bdellovibrionia bacterium]